MDAKTLALYLGCKAQATTVSGYKQVSTLNEIDLRDNCAVIGDELCYVDRVKPFLRPPTSMTNAEREELFDLMYPTGNHGIVWKGKMDFIGLWFGIDEDLPSYQIIVDDVASMSFQDHAIGIKYLLSKHFDLFDLIGEGQALDATKQ